MPVHGTWEPEVVRECRRLLRPGMVAVDVGAHIGYYTTLFAELAGPGGRVYAFEPHPGNFEVLSANARAPNVTCVRAALGARDAGGQPLYVGTDSGRHSLAASGSTRSRTAPLHVETRRLDTWWHAEARPEVDLVKVDVEGLEDDVLAGGRAMLEACRSVALLVEWHPDLLRERGRDPDAVPALLAELGFAVQPIDGTDTTGEPGTERRVNVLCRR